MIAPIFVESYVIISLAFHRLAMGFVMAYPSTLTAAITGNTTDVRATADEAAWIASAYSITGVLGFFILPPLMQMYGRKITNIFNNLIIFVGSIVIAMAPGVPELVAGRAIQGVGFCGILLNILIAAEYCHPKRRGFIVTFKGIAAILGILLCHSLGFIMTWRQIAWLASAPAAIGAITTVFWPESPSWLANKGRYDDCVKSFELIRGTDLESQKEMRELLIAQQEIRKYKHHSNNFFLTSVRTLQNKTLLKPFVLIALLVTLAHVTGIYYLMAYVIEIMQKLTGDQNKTFYYTVGLDVFKFFANLISSGAIKFFNRRTVLFSSGTLACVLLSFVCIFDYLESINYLSLRWLTPMMLIVYSFVCQAGVIEVYHVLAGELFPLEQKCVGITFLGIVYSIIGFVTLRYTSTMLLCLHVYGTFAVYLVIAVACLICLFLILPETKDKTLQSIESTLVHEKYDKNHICPEKVELRAAAS